MAKYIVTLHDGEKVTVEHDFTPFIEDGVLFFKSFGDLGHVFAKNYWVRVDQV
jgi:hypothetical protein